MKRAPAHYIVLKTGKRMNTLLLESLHPAGKKHEASAHARFVCKTQNRDTFVATIIEHNIVSEVNVLEEKKEEKE